MKFFKRKKEMEVQLLNFNNIVKVHIVDIFIDPLLFDTEEFKLDQKNIFEKFENVIEFLPLAHFIIDQTSLQNDSLANLLMENGVDLNRYSYGLGIFPCYNKPGIKIICSTPKSLHKESLLIGTNYSDDIDNSSETIYDLIANDSTTDINISIITYNYSNTLLNRKEVNKLMICIAHYIKNNKAVYNEVFGDIFKSIKSKKVINYIQLDKNGSMAL